MPRKRRQTTPSAGRPVSGSVEIRPFKDGSDATFWLRVMVEGQRQSRRLGRASEGWTPVLAEAERRRVLAEIQAGIYIAPTVELPLEERDPAFHVWASRWLDVRAGDIEPKTFEQYEYLLRRQLLPTLHATGSPRSPRNSRARAAHWCAPAPSLTAPDTALRARL